MKKILSFFKKIRKNLIDDKNKLYQWVIYWGTTALPYRIIKRFHKLKKNRQFIFSELKIWMANEEIELITKYLYPSDVMLEWGAGGSTVYFSRFVKKYYSIEHTFNWYYRAKKQAKSNVKLKYIPPNLPRNVRLIPPFKPEQFVDYVHGVSRFKEPIFNKVFIDGRARVECAKEVLKYINKDSIVFIHDFYRRKHYHTILEFYDKLEEIKTGSGLIALKLKFDK